MPLGAKSNAWVDVPTLVNTAHATAECSNKVPFENTAHATWVDGTILDLIPGHL